MCWVSTFIDESSLERIKAYTSIENERKSTPEGQPPAYWPSSGKLQVNNLSARYSVDGPDVLKDVSFAVQSGERVGIGEFISQQDERAWCDLTEHSISGPYGKREELPHSCITGMHPHHRRDLLR